MSTRFAAVILLLGICAPFAFAGEESTVRREALSVLLLHSGHENTEEPVKCGLPLVSAAMLNSGRQPGIVGDALAQLLVRPVMQTSRAAGQFRVHYDTSGIDAAALLDAQGQRIAGTAHVFADSALAIIAHVHAVETGPLGYDPPQQDGVLGGGPEYDVYIMELGNLYGYTTPDRNVPSGDTSSTHISIDNDFRFVRPDEIKGLPALRVTLAHEYHHAIQISRYGYWTQDIFFYEITSTWLEDVLYTDVNDYYSYLRASWGHFLNPERSFLSGNDLIMYSRAIWGHYVTRRFGIETMRRCWELARGVRLAEAIDLALRERGSSLPDAFGEWTLWNHFTGSRSDPARFYDEGAFYPLITEVPAGYVPPVREIHGTLAPLSARFYEVPLGADTLTVVAGHLNLAQALQSAPASAYSLFLAGSRVDGTYQPTPTGLFMKLSVPSPSTWGLWSILRGTIGGGPGSPIEEGTAYPNPFRVQAGLPLHIPVDSPVPVRGTVSIFTPSMDRIRSYSALSSLEVGRQVFQWDGKTDDGSLAQTGVYVVVISLSDRIVTSKVALLGGR